MSSGTYKTLPMSAYTRGIEYSSLLEAKTIKKVLKVSIFSVLNMSKIRKNDHSAGLCTVRTENLTQFEFLSNILDPAH